MDDRDYIALDTLIMKVQQHEETIAQLIEMIAATNRKLSEISRAQHEQKHQYSLS